MVHAAGLEDDALVGPAHRPVDLPDELAAVELVEPDRLREAAGRAGVVQLGRVVVVGRDDGEVLLAVAAVGLVREVAGGAGAAVVLVRRAGALGGLQLGLVDLLLLRLPALGALRTVLLGAVAVQHGVDVGAVPHRVQDLLAVRTRQVLLGLADAVVLDAELVERLRHRGLEVLGPVRVRRPGRGGHGRERLADVRVPRVVDALHAVRHLAVAVVVVPGDQVAHGVAAAADLVGDEVRGHDLAEVAQVDRARRGEPGRDDDRFARRTSLRLGDDIVREAGDPVGLGAALTRSHGRHVLLSCRTRRGVPQQGHPHSPRYHPQRENGFTPRGILG